MRVVIVSQFFKPEPAIMPSRLAKELARQGHDVVVITAFPSRPGGALFSGYAQRFGYEENLEGVRVRRVPTVISHDRNAVRRIGSFLSFAAASLTEFGWARGADIVYVYATPMTAAIAPRIWRALFGTPYVLHVQDLWPESVTESGMLGNGRASAVARSALDTFLQWIYRGAEHTVAIAPSMAKTLESRGVDPDRLSVVLNWGDEENLTRVERIPEGGGLRVVYAGNMGRFQDVRTIVEAARMVQDVPGLRIDLFGDGTDLESLQEQVAGLENITFHGRVPREEMEAIYARSDFQLVTLMDLPLFKGTIPSKFQGSMAAGIPVITTVKGDVRDFVRDNHLGLTAEPENPQDLAMALRKAYQLPEEQRAQMGQNALGFYEREMSFSGSGKRIQAILAEASRRIRNNNRQAGQELGSSI
jgi:colanic acid biosynthesis glycosyl transferase WcaI